MTGIGCGSALALSLALLPSGSSLARDLDGHYAQMNPEMHKWFNGLANGKGGLCCSFADGRSLDDPDVDMNGDHYRVRIDGQWIDVPDDAIVKGPNKLGRPVVWPFETYDAESRTYKPAIRCFLPGAGA